MAKTRRKDYGQASAAPSTRPNGQTSTTVNVRITDHFAVRKRHGGAEKSAGSDVELLNKRLRRGINITDCGQRSLLESESESEFSGSTGRRGPALETGKENFAVHKFPTAMGVFDQVHGDVVHVFLNAISISHLTTLALTSHAWYDRLRNYALTNVFFQRAKRAFSKFDENESRTQHFTPEDPYVAYAKFLKSISVCERSGVRIKNIVEFMDRVGAYLQPNNGFGRFIKTFCGNWAFSECEELVHKLLENINEGCFNLTFELDLVTKSAPGEHPQLELKIRKWLHALFLGDLCGNDIAENSFWLVVCLKKYQSSPVACARLFMIMSLPFTLTEQGECVIDWRTMCDEATTSFEDSKASISPMARALCRVVDSQLIKEDGYGYSNHEIFNLIEEITTTPEPWAFDNFASLFIHEPKLIPFSLVARMTHGFEEEAGQMVNTIKQLCYRWDVNLQNTLYDSLKITFDLLPTNKRMEFYIQINNAHGRQMKDMANSGRPLESFFDELSAQGALLRLLSTLCVPMLNGVSA